jgi:hypothetical protein
MFDIRAIGIALAVVGTAPAIAISAQAKVDDSTKIVCKRVAPTGSLVADKVVCRSKSMWKSGVEGRADRNRIEQPLVLEAGEGQAIQAGSAKWETLPPLKERPAHLPYSRLIPTVEEMLRKGECQMPGQTPKSFDIVVPFAVLVEPDGKATRVLIPEETCAPVGTLVGLVALSRARRGDFLPTNEPKARWYSSSINFTVSGG